MSVRRRGVAIGAAALILLASAGVPDRAAGARAAAGPDGVAAWIDPATPPHHGSWEGLAYGGHGELRFGHDRVRGAADPEWFHVGRVNGFVRAALGSRARVAGEGAWDRAADDFSIERADLEVEVRPSVRLHAGIFLAPLGLANLEHDAPRSAFPEHSLVATDLVGVPNPMLGIGVRGVRGAEGPLPISYEVDLVTGYDDGLIMDSPGGTRLADGRNNYGDNNGMPALAVRVALHPSGASHAGLSAQSGQYNETEIGDVAVDRRRYVHLGVADAATEVAGCRVSGEAAAVFVDVPPGLGALYAERQWGASLEVGRTLLGPIVRGWRHSRLSAAIRADAVDFDRGVEGDSRSRLSASLNLHQLPRAVTRFGWYYELRRDRFNNPTPAAGVTLTAATYF